VRHGSCSDFVEPAPTTGDRGDKLGAGLSTNRASSLRRCGFWHDDLAPSFRRRFLPGNKEDRAICFQPARLSLFWCLDLDRQLVRLHLDAHDVGADEVSVIARSRAGIDEETGIGKWGPVPERFQDIKVIDAMPAWDDDWPTLSVQNYNGGKRLKLSCAALYWAIKDMVNTLAADSAIGGRARGRR
jgi:hypothetical protein